MFQGYSLIIAISFHNCKENAVSSRIGRYSIVFLYVMAFWPDLLSGLDRAIALAWSKAQWCAGGFPRLF